jgi:hypothetical protein
VVRGLARAMDGEGQVGALLTMVGIGTFIMSFAQNQSIAFLLLLCLFPSGLVITIDDWKYNQRLLKSIIHFRKPHQER